MNDLTMAVSNIFDPPSGSKWNTSFTKAAGLERYTIAFPCSHSLLHPLVFLPVLSSQFVYSVPGLGRRVPISNDDSFDSFGLTSRLTLNMSNLMQTPRHIISECKVENKKSSDDVPIGPTSTSSVLLCKEMR